MISTLDELANKHSTDKGTLYAGSSKHGYAPIYDTYLKTWRNNPIRLLEVGVCMEGTNGGHSIGMWMDYFPAAEIFTFDIVDMSNHPYIAENERVNFFRGNQEVREDFEKMYIEFGNIPFDFILEDGSHEHHHQMISFAALFPYVKSGGYYILEDISIPEHPVCCIRNDDTYRIIEEFKTTGMINSEHITESEKAYLEKHLDIIEMHSDIQDAYSVAIIRKK